MRIELAPAQGSRHLRHDRTAYSTTAACSLAALPGETARWVRGVMADVAAAGIEDVAAVRVLRDGRKQLAVLESRRGSPLVLKQYADDRGAWTRRWLQELAAAGLRAPGEFRVTLARGWSATHRTLLTDLAPGTACAQWLSATAQDRDAAAVAAADWLTTLQGLTIALPDRTAHRAIASLRRESSRLAAAFPEAGNRLRRIAAAVPRHLDATGSVRLLVASHGDLHLNNLHVWHMATAAPLVVTAIDVDTAGMRRPSYDVGYALGQMLVFSWMRTGSFRAGARAGRAFWRRWAATGEDAGAVPAQVARTLVQSLHFELVTYRTGRTVLLGRWLDLAEAVLGGGVEGALVRAEEVDR